MFILPLFTVCRLGWLESFFKLARKQYLFPVGTFKVKASVANMLGEKHVSGSLELYYESNM